MYRIDVSLISFSAGKKNKIGSKTAAIAGGNA